MPDSHHLQAQGDGTPGKPNSTRAREGEKSGWKRKRPHTEMNEKRGNKLADREKSLPQTTKEFVIYSCNICGFTKEKFEALMEYTRPAPPDAIVLVETNLMWRRLDGRYTRPVVPQNQVAGPMPVPGECRYLFERDR